ncbi:MAG TPA: alpha/beta hydrolase [Mycobacteriales bacterium]|nr:alpha/beta hydrolase [Mycobacteriales bacterium]
MRALLAGIGALAIGLSGAATAGDAAAAPTAQRIQWGRCDPGIFPVDRPENRRVQCGTFRAPRDWNHPGDGHSITIAVSRQLPRHGRPQGTIFTNPGGPGSPGRFMAASMSRLADRFQILGMDVRGTGGSTNVSCGETAAAAPATMDPRDRSPQNIRAMLAATAAATRACQRAMGALGPFITTEQTVHDIDLFRRLLHVGRLDYYGLSDGTWLGAYYATYFPARVGAMVLDSVVDVSGTRQQAAAEQPMGSQRRFDADFLPWVARYDATYHLGTSAAAVDRGYEALRARLAAHPQLLPGVGRVDGGTLDQLIVGEIKSKYAFPTLAAQLRDLAGAQAAAPAATAPDAAGATAIALACNDTPFRGGQAGAVIDSGLQGLRYPLFGWQQIFQPCATWHRPPVHLPKPTGRGVPPILLVNSVYDPATPYEGALRTHRTLAGSRLITVTGEGDHGLYGDTNECVDSLVDGYFRSQRPPHTDLRCPGVPLPKPPNGP